MTDIAKYRDCIKELAPDLYFTLRSAVSIKTAREGLVAYLHRLSAEIHGEEENDRTLEWYLRLNCLRVFREVISVRSERLTASSALEILYFFIHEKSDKYPCNLSAAFFEDVLAIIRGMLGLSGIFDDEKAPGYMNLTGREAAIARSEDLDGLAGKLMDRIRSIPSGLDEDLISRRRENRNRIQTVYGASDEEWNDYLWQLRHVIRDSKTLAALVELSDEERRGIDMAKEARLPFGITPYYVMLMDKEKGRKQDYAVRAQVIPPTDYVTAIVSHRDDPDYRLDFMREHDTSPIDLITRRYPLICILKPYNTCGQICVYCQRNWEIEDVLMPQALASNNSIEAATTWLRRHPSITEVLVTGGDPLVLGDQKFDTILAQIAAIPHVERIRIGSRTPVVVPQRFTEKLIGVFKKYHEPGRRELVLMTHIEHPYEVTPELMEAVQKIRRLGISVYNQAVFTTNNSRRYEMAALRRILKLIGIDNYYTFNTKGKEETRAYRVPLARLQQEVKEEARLMPGLVRTDEAVYNVPGLGKNYLRAEQNHALLTIKADGSRVYEFHSWEKNLARAATYVDSDVPILDYLREMERRGEDLQEYRTIWYYF